ncbi:hypothetical protein MNEG_3533 [Monoraphidium neglectum]|uniref:L-ascorbate peroxidase n=1 Tax=Monoraphidium neglectum TaxID=145388 RepID=A0A0D2MV77_9CHLO|nr:hypothetical protein MNEG_3533 [Monoraphidium neglectum]KIZ04422.1 hypothetical protein MNEG_3533 [Monoraphidium neglectum]|eukprot:XP_013903441.1 hypothetical protein MNEG_3533 [Monoraphidium neglectum]
MLQDHVAASGASASGLARRHALLLLPSASGALLRLVAGAAAAGSPPLLAPGYALAGVDEGVVPSPAVKAAIDKAIDSVVNVGKAPLMLRLAYHDAGTFSKKAGDGGLNASIQFELDRPENFGLKRGWRLVEQAKASLKGTPADGLVSNADLIAWAGARAVAVTGGPRVPLTIGRADARAADPPGRMASERSGPQALIDNFADKGFGVRELVALSGAHTIGGKGFGDAATFDNAYYTSLLAKPWLDKTNPMWDHIGLPSDHALPEDPRTLEVIQEYARDQAAFFDDFSAAFQKLCATGVTLA